MDNIELVGEYIFRFETSLLPQCLEVSSDHMKRIIFQNGLLYLFREDVSYEDFDSYDDLREYMRQRYWELARVMREDEQTSHYVPIIVLARRVGDDEQDPSYQAIIAKEVENWLNVEENEDPKNDIKTSHTS